MDMGTTIIYLLFWTGLRTTLHEWIGSRRHMLWGCILTTYLGNPPIFTSPHV